MSKLADRIDDDMKAAMRAKEALRVSTIRMLRSELLLVSKNQKNEPASDTQIVTTVEKMIKQRVDAASQFRAADRVDLAEKEEAEAEILRVYLPEPLSDAELTALIDQAFDAVKPEGMRDMGKVIGLLKPKLAGQADMTQVSKTVKERLQ